MNWPTEAHMQGSAALHKGPTPHKSLSQCCLHITVAFGASTESEAHMLCMTDNVNRSLYTSTLVCSTSTLAQKNIDGHYPLLRISFGNQRGCIQKVGGKTARRLTPQISSQALLSKFCYVVSVRLQGGAPVKHGLMIAAE